MISQDQKEGTRTAWCNPQFNLQVSWLPPLDSAEQLGIKHLITSSILGINSFYSKESDVTSNRISFKLLYIKSSVYNQGE